MFNIDEKYFFPHMPKTDGNFPPDKPNYTMSDEMEHTIGEMRAIIDRLAKFEKRLDKKVEDFLAHFSSDNALFKNAFAESYNQFLMEVKNEVNAFEGNMDSALTLFKTTLEADYATLSEDCKTQIADSYAEFVAKLNEYRQAIEERIEDYNNALSDSFNGYTSTMNTNFATLESDLRNEYAKFKTSVQNSINTFRTEFTNTITARLNGQDSKINDAILYMKTNLNSSIEILLHNMEDNGELVGIIDSDVMTTVKQYGAVGDGITDDTNAIQSCLDSGMYIYIPDGTYLISRTLEIKKTGQRLIGMSLNAKLKASADLTAPIIKMTGANSHAYRSYQEISNITVEGNGVCDGIKFVLDADFSINRVRVTNCSIGIDSADSLIYSVKDSTVDGCAKGIVFRARDAFSPANNVKFDCCRIYACDEYAIYSESGGSTHGVVFDTCEIEANNVDKISECAILLQSTATSGEMPIITFNNCWFENNRGSSSVIIITNAHTNHPCYIFNGNVLLNESKTVPKFIDATGVCLYVVNNNNPSEYSDIAIDLHDTRFYNFGCTFKHRTDDDEFCFIVGYNGKVASDLNFMNGKGTNYISESGTGYNKIYSSSNHLKMESEKGKVSLNGAMGVDTNNSYEKPLILGNIYLWSYGKTIYAKSGALPASATDGTVVITCE